MRMLPAAALVCCFVSLAGAGQLPSATGADAATSKLETGVEHEVRARVASWWKAREQRDHPGMYALMEPAYRQKVAFADFVKENAKRTRFDLTDPRIDGIVLESIDRVHVKVTTQLHPPGLPTAPVTADDIWVFVAGQWWKVHQETTIPFSTSR